VDTIERGETQLRSIDRLLDRGRRLSSARIDLLLHVVGWLDGTGGLGVTIPYVTIPYKAYDSKGAECREAELSHVANEFCTIVSVKKTRSLNPVVELGRPSGHISMAF